MVYEIIFWAIAFVVLAILEIASFQLVSIWFSLSSLLSLTAAAFNAPIWLQCIIFIVSSTVLLILTRPFVKRILGNGYIPTNSELDVGKSGVVIEKIDNAKQTGRVRVSGIDWTANSENNEIIDNGKSIIVKEVKGTTLVVSQDEISAADC